MAFSFQRKLKFLVFSLVLVAIFCRYLGYAAEDNVGEVFEKAFGCFNNKFIYSGCDEAYRLNEEGNINVPPEAINLFCSGPCLTETELVLKCVDNSFSNFLFYNKATVNDIRGALRTGCSSTSQRGLFNFGEFIQGETSNSPRLLNLIGFYKLLMITWCCYFVI